jgi:hypothetical protein
MEMNAVINNCVFLRVVWYRSLLAVISRVNQWKKYCCSLIRASQTVCRPMKTVIGNDVILTTASFYYLLLFPLILLRLSR